MKYNFSDWNNKQGTIPVQWKANDYQDLPWYENPDKNQGFTTPKENYDILDAMNGYFIWDGIEASTLWIEKQFKEVNAKLYGLGLDENTLIIADKNLTTCLKQIKMDRPNFIPFITERFLPYLKEKCLVQNFSVKKKVDNKGKITEERIPLKKISCIDFNYNARDYSYWNSTTFALMLVWKEAHPVLSTIFDSGAVPCPPFSRRIVETYPA